MCGFVGFLNLNGGPDADAAIALRMASAIAHRGPDADAVWAEGPVALGHRRLSIIDLSPAGAQPMLSHCGRHMLAYNGEIYNYREIRAELEQTDYFRSVVQAWRGHSDTEVMLAAIGCWGLNETLRRMVGMFAIALWDRQDRSLTLIRDRAGEKPLYYGQVNGVLLFGSELKALRAHPAFRAEIDRGAVALYMRHNYIPAPYTIYQGVRKLMPGTLLRIEADGRETAQTYWSLPQVIGARPGAGLDLSPEAAVDRLESVLSQAVADQMVADVPLGAFLSGGIDSSTVVALMQAQSSTPVRTFSIGFHEDGYDEAQYARAVATHLKTDHTELYVSAQEAMAVIPDLPQIYDEPFSDSSQIPTFLVSRMARRHVTVALSGDAGDELFSGYRRYTMTTALWGKLGRLPGPVRSAVAAVLRAVPVGAWNAFGGLVPSIGGRLGDKLHKGAGVLSCRSVDALYQRLISHWEDPATVVQAGREHDTVLTRQPPELARLTPVERMMALDFLSYLPDDILVKVDRAAMANSLETRVPMLDHRVVELAWSLPQSLKYRSGTGKWLLRQVLYRHVPQAMMDRPKMGFGVPLDSWLRGPLREWAEGLLAEGRLRQDGIFDPQPVRHLWAEHLQGHRNWAYHLWDVLMFNAWMDAQSAP